MQTQLKWLTSLQTISDRLRVLRSRRKTQRCLSEIESLEKEWKRLKNRVKPDLMRRFEMLLERRQGKAIVPIRGKSCGACGLVLPDQVVVDVQTREFIITCESCSRFLYWDRDEERRLRKERMKAASESKEAKPARKPKTPKKAGDKPAPSPKKRKAGAKKPPKTKRATSAKPATKKKKTKPQKAAAKKTPASRSTSTKTKKKSAARSAKSKRTSSKTNQ